MHRYKYEFKTGVTKVKTKLAIAFTALGVGSAGIFGAAAILGTAHAATTVVVTPQNQQGWSTADTRPGGNVNFVNDSTAPGGSALQLTTNATNAAKAQYLNAANTPLSQVTELSYSTKQITANVPDGDPSYQVGTCLGGVVNGACVGFSNLVYEPYWNGTVTKGAWQQWNVSAGQFWTSGNYNDDNHCVVSNSFGGPPLYTLSQINNMCPNAIVVDFGVNAGSYNPRYNTETDLVDFNGTVYDFQTAPQPPVLVTLASKDDCRNNGWMTSNNPYFKNQGDCVSYFATKGKNGGNGSGPSTAYNHFVYGSVTLDNPVQQLNFSGDMTSDTGTFTYTNTNPKFSYTTNLTCVNVDGNTAYLTYQIPSTAAYAANVWVVWKVVDNGTSDTAGFTTAPDGATANAMCQSGSATVTNYTITAGDIVVL